MKRILVVQARTGSTRLPGKVLMPIEDRPMLAHVLERAGAIPGLDEKVLSLYDLPEDQPLIAIGEAAGFRVDVAEGIQVGDVLGRFNHATASYDADTAIVRVTADCPLFDPAVCAEGFRFGVDALSMGTNSPVEETGWFDGLDYEIIPVGVLRQAHSAATDPDDRQHVTRWIRRSLALIGYLGPSPRDRELLDTVPVHRRKWSVDTQADLDLVREVYRAGAAASWRTVAAYLAGAAA